jgi:hypothetical protein
MSLRVQNDPSSAVGSSEASRGAQTVTGASATGGSKLSTGVAGGDHVQVSSVAESIGAGNSALDAQRANRVSQLSALYAGGKYAVNSAQVSAALVANATTATPAGTA